MRQIKLRSVRTQAANRLRPRRKRRSSGKESVRSAIRSTVPCLIAVAVLAACVLNLPAWGQGMTLGILSPPANVRPPGLKNVGIEQHLNQQIPPGLTFRDETGRAVELSDYFGKKPMILNLVYYQ